MKNRFCSVFQGWRCKYSQLSTHEVKCQLSSSDISLPLEIFLEIPSHNQHSRCCEAYICIRDSSVGGSEGCWGTTLRTGFCTEFSLGRTFAPLWFSSMIGFKVGTATELLITTSKNLVYAGGAIIKAKKAGCKSFFLTNPAFDADLKTNLSFFP